MKRSTKYSQFMKGVRELKNNEKAINKTSRLKNGTPIIFYTYLDEPLSAKTGDHVRVKHMLQCFSKKIQGQLLVIAFNLKPLRVHNNNVLLNVKFMEYVRPVYEILKDIISRNEPRTVYDRASKASIFVDEMFVALKYSDMFKRSKKVYIFGSMSIMPVILKKILHVGSNIIFDTFGNHSQTLYYDYFTEKNVLKKAIKLMKYAVYASVHKLSLEASDTVIYPTFFDMENAIRMFKIKNKKLMIVPNFTPICYESVEEYQKLRNLYRESHSIPHFVFLAGARTPLQYEAVKATILMFNDLPSQLFRLYITGPWLDLKHLVRNPSINLLGTLSDSSLKALITSSDYGLAPLFTHCCGSYIKILSYISGGLTIITTPCGIVGLDKGLALKLISDGRIILVKSIEDFRKKIQQIVTKSLNSTETQRNIVLCKQVENELLKIVNSVNLLAER